MLPCLPLPLRGVQSTNQPVHGPPSFLPSFPIFSRSYFAADSCEQVPGALLRCEGSNLNLNQALVPLDRNATVEKVEQVEWNSSRRKLKYYMTPHPSMTLPHRTFFVVFIFSCFLSQAKRSSEIRSFTQGVKYSYYTLDFRLGPTFITH